MLLTRPPRKQVSFRLACVKPAASVRSEPGSNSSIVLKVWLTVSLCHNFFGYLRDLLSAYQWPIQCKTSWIRRMYFVENKTLFVLTIPTVSTFSLLQDFDPVLTAPWIYPMGRFVSKFFINFFDWKDKIWILKRTACFILRVL